MEKTDEMIEVAARVIRKAAQQPHMCECPMHTLFPQRISELVEPTHLDLEAACNLIGKDTYGKRHWEPDTISPCNPVVQAFARHARQVRAIELFEQGFGK